MAREDDRAFEVYEENWQALLVFLDCQTQWTVTMGGTTGLNYTALEAVIRLSGIARKQHPEIFAKVRLIERGALERMAQQRHHQ